MDFDTFQKEAQKYDSTKEILIPLMGLCGEIGEINSVLKKRYRDRRAYTHFTEHLREELGDTLWYLSSICSHLGLKLEDVANENLRSDGTVSITHTCKDFPEYQERVKQTNGDRGLSFLSALSKNAANLFKIYTTSDKKERISEKFIKKMAKEVGDVLWYLANIASLYSLEMSFVASNNIDKIRKIHDEGELSEFDKVFPDDESIPRQIGIKIIEITENGESKVKMYLNDIELGDELDDNSPKEDFYRFHDAFHLAYVAILGWSPVMRKLLDRKRKSDTYTDRIQDGARARILEEAVSLYIFNDAEKNNLYEGSESIDLSVLKNVKELTKDLEVSSCTYKQWEKAIINGYEIFRQLIEHRNGIVELDMDKQSISFKKIEG